MRDTFASLWLFLQLPRVAHQSDPSMKGSGGLTPPRPPQCGWATQQTAKIHPRAHGATQSTLLIEDLLLGPHEPKPLASSVDQH